MHRDVKPSNVLLDRQDEREHCYLADFGLTQSASERGPTDGQFMGTVAYVSPEQIRGERWTAAPTSTASPACSSSASPGPFRTATRSDVAAIFAHLEEPVPPASERGAELPAALDPVLARGMAKDPDDRYESCAALVAAASRRRWAWSSSRPTRALAPGRAARGRRAVVLARHRRRGGPAGG